VSANTERKILGVALRMALLMSLAACASNSGQTPADSMGQGGLNSHTGSRIGWLTSGNSRISPWFRWGHKEDGIQGDLADKRLLNSKAARYPDFAYRLLDRVSAAVRELEVKKISATELPPDLRAVVITGVLNGRGKLTELALEQHSGRLAVDNLVLEACRRGLWANDPPPGPLGADGSYRVRIEAWVRNYGVDGIANRFRTQMGIALL
jgi:hypothetical protein